MMYDNEVLQTLDSDEISAFKSLTETSKICQRNLPYSEVMLSVNRIAESGAETRFRFEGAKQFSKAHMNVITPT